MKAILSYTRRVRDNFNIFLYPALAFLLMVIVWVVFENWIARKLQIADRIFNRWKPKRQNPRPMD